MTWIAFCAVAAQAKVHEESLEEAKQNITLANTLVSLLQKYDTDGVKEALEERKSVADPELVKAFLAMNTNLEKYRPFLPNYMFNADTDAEGASDDEGSILSSGADDASSNRASRYGSSTRTSELSEPRHSATVGGDKHLGRVPSGSNEKSISQRISMAYIDCRTITNDNSEAGVPRSESEALAIFVDIVYTAASATQGAVHSMIGDQVILTWNAACRVIQPETKCARFLCRVKAASIENGLCLAGAACSGPSVCHSIVSSTKQQTLIIQHSWRPLLNAMQQLACAHRTILMDRSTYNTAHFEIDAYPVDSITYDTENGPATPSTRSQQPYHARWRSLVEDISIHRLVEQSPSPFTTLSEKSEVIYEVACEKKHEEDEWMYQLQKDDVQAGSSTLLAKVFEKILQRDVSAAKCLVENLNEMQESQAVCNKRSALVERLLRSLN